MAKVENCPIGRTEYSEDACRGCKWRAVWRDHVKGTEVGSCVVDAEGELIDDEEVER